MLVGVTGGSGFIGRRLVVECLSRGYQVKVLSRKDSYPIRGVTVCRGDLTDAQSDLNYFVENLDILYHCAGELKDESLMQELHVGGTKRLLEASVGNIGRWVQLSSVGVYGPKRSGIIDENTPIGPSGTYELTKSESDLAVIDVASRNGMQYSILRPSIVFGSDMPNQSLTSMLKMIRMGFFFYIGPAGSVMNYVHISSVVKALILCGEHADASGNSYILSDHLTIEEMVSALAHGIGGTEPKIRIPEIITRSFAAIFQKFPGMPLTKSRIDAMTGSAVYSTEKIRRELGYEEKISLADQFRSLSNLNE